MGVVPDAGAEVLASAPAKGGKHPAVDTFRGVDPAAARAPRPIGLRSGWSVPRTSDKTQKKKADILSESVQKILCPCKIRRVFPSTSTTTTTTSLLINHFLRP